MNQIYKVYYRNGKNLQRLGHVIGDSVGLERGRNIRKY